MKKIILTLLVALVILVAFILFKTSKLKAITYPTYAKTEVDAKINTLQEALRFETISHKKEMIDSSAFGGLHAYLDSVFPNITQKLEKTLVNDYSLVYKWKGSDPKAGNVVLMGHQDVVPVEYATRDEWDAAPFSGEIKDDYIYGRGTLDDKGAVLAILNGVEGLIEQGFTPRQTVYLCFGHDEEIGGEEGAQEIVKLLKQQGVSANLVLDENQKRVMFYFGR